MKKLTIIAAIFMVGCASGAQDTYRAAESHTSGASDDGASSPSLEARQGVERVIAATARYQNIDVAIADGWTNQYPEGCAESSEGAQAYHYLNPDLVDAEVDLLRPELFMYERQEDGSMELVGVDYVIPFDQWDGDGPPTLLGQTFGRNEPLGVWAIHIWAFRTNPLGTFAPWNPAVSCAYAG